MAAPLYRLYSPPGSLFAFAPLVVSEYVGVSIDIANNTEGSIEQIIASKSPTGKSPILETRKGLVIVSSQAIARFIANLRRDTDVLGTTGSLRDATAIEDWTNWAAQELELPVCVSYYMVTECIPFDETSFTKAKKDISCALSVLESHLQKESSSSSIEKMLARTYLVLPEQVTLVFDEADLKKFPKVKRWFVTCMQQPEFISVLGTIECGKSRR
jgi:elongation factor 1-gamma